jgi:hypothetical protein
MLRNLIIDLRPEKEKIHKVIRKKAVFYLDTILLVSRDAGIGRQATLRT